MPAPKKTPPTASPAIRQSRRKDQEAPTETLTSPPVQSRGGGPGGWGAGEVLTPIGAGGVRGNRSEKALQDVTNPQAAHPLVASPRASPRSPSANDFASRSRESRTPFSSSCGSTTRRSRCGGGSPRSEAERRGGAQPEHSSHLAPAFFTCTPPPRPPAPQADSSVDAFDRGGGSVNESRWACWFPFTLPPPRSDASRLPRACGAGGRGGGVQVKC